MTAYTRFFLSFVCLLVLSGCVSREQADAKLARACEAAVNVFLDEDQQIGEVKNATFSGSPVGTDYRHVTIHTITMDGWIEAENDYDCVFQEGFGFMSMGYTASIYQVTVHDQTVGKSGNEILGTASDHMKLNEAVRAALYEN